MYSTLLQTIIDRHGYQVVTEAELDTVAEAQDFSVLFFAGDSNRLAESDDVAVILPELTKLFKHVFTPLIVDRDSERILQQRYRFNAFPTLVFLRRGDYLGAVSRVLDWGDYATEISNILMSEPSVPPAFEFPGCISQQSAH